MSKRLRMVKVNLRVVAYMRHAVKHIIANFLHATLSLLLVVSADGRVLYLVKFLVISFTSADL